MLAMRKPCGSSFSRPLGFTQANVSAYLLVEAYLKRNYPADWMNVVDEAGLTVIQNEISQVFERKGTHEPTALTFVERGSKVTVAECMSVLGHYIPRSTIFHRKNMSSN
ncbi:hypothetical protein HHI36_003147 [Cryptolaemus montrouzieri]|uniref:Uncharacterized protein n=1 Tax=Cryptolaemus montrouzieri TaxID=559131 RepID=A0ABD2PCM0_9CUCU